MPERDQSCVSADGISLSAQGREPRQSRCCAENLLQVRGRVSAGMELGPLHLPMVSARMSSHTSAGTGSLGECFIYTNREHYSLTENTAPENTLLSLFLAVLV